MRQDLGVFVRGASTRPHNGCTINVADPHWRTLPTARVDYALLGDYRALLNRNSKK